jgi:hypothetical protein
VVNLIENLFGFGPGRHAPARFLCAALLAVATPALAQQAPAQPLSSPPLSAVPVPGELELAKMIWSTMVAVDHANISGNYSVLRDIAAPGFQINNDAAKLTEIFSSLRASRVDLSNTLLLAPTYRSAPAMVQRDVMRVQGGFGLRPTAIDFELYYQWVSGRWRLFGVSVAPASIATQQPGPPGTPIAPVKPPPTRPPAGR